MAQPTALYKFWAIDMKDLNTAFMLCSDQNDFGPTAMSKPCFSGL